MIMVANLASQGLRNPNPSRTREQKPPHSPLGLRARLLSAVRPTFGQQLRLAALHCLNYPLNTGSGQWRPYCTILQSTRQSWSKTLCFLWQAVLGGWVEVLACIWADWVASFAGPRVQWKYIVTLHRVCAVQLKRWWADIALCNKSGCNGMCFGFKMHCHVVARLQCSGICVMQCTVAGWVGEDISLSNLVALSAQQPPPMPAPLVTRQVYWANCLQVLERQIWQFLWYFSASCCLLPIRHGRTTTRKNGENAGEKQHIHLTQCESYWAQKKYEPWSKSGKLSLAPSAGIAITRTGLKAMDVELNCAVSLPYLALSFSSPCKGSPQKKTVLFGTIDPNF